jgi:EcsC protein family
MDDYERQAWNDIQGWRDRKPRVRVARLVPKSVRDRTREGVRKGTDAVRQIPGAEQFERALTATLEGLLRALMDVGTASVSRAAAVRRLRRKGHQVSQFEDVRALPLRACDTAFPARKRFAYMGGSAAQGAVAGVAATVGDVEALVGGGITVFEGGVGAAPGAAQVAAVMVGDMAVLLLGASRLAAETGAAYGYDPNDPAEKLFVAGVLGVATASTEAAKLAAYQELSQLTQMLARRATWEALNSNQIVKILTKLYSALGFKLYKKPLATAVPVAGVVLGAGINAGFMSGVADEAYYAYRERRLREDYGDDFGDVSARSGHPAPPDADVIPITEIVEAELGEDSDQ